MRPQTGTNGTRLGPGRDATFGQRRAQPQSQPSAPGGKRASRNDANIGEEGGLEMSWVPSSSAQEDSSFSGKSKRPERRKGVETFGAGMERGGENPVELSENDRKGRTQRRQGTRSGSKNVFRRM